VTELIQSASDDQVALAICFAAVTFCGLVMYFSHYVGRLSGRAGSSQQRTLPLTANAARPLESRRQSASAARDKAA
jgi:hypothetical protein